MEFVVIDKTEDIITTTERFLDGKQANEHIRKICEKTDFAIAAVEEITDDRIYIVISCTND